MATKAAEHRTFFVESFLEDNQLGGLRTLTGPVVKCRKCGAKKGFHRRRPEDLPQDFFKKHGWQLGGGVYMDLCPDCANTKPIKIKEPKKKMASNVTKLETVKAEQPREITREERQRIHAKIGDHYLDTGYSPPWTDRAIAEAEKVPLAWVSEIREQFYGPEGSNPLYDKFEADAQAFVDAYNELCAVKGQIDALEIMGREIKETMDRIKRETRGIRK
ncbi:hypothetical protein DES43_1544 [Aquamicrobium defluvii]|uniref:Uncharacterized protein n=2 Tax=Aquamicrobium defluvii TaxID=69279 RepID=A0A4R6Y4V8_9HYPH|nr:hypothetical protein DES43_1544 [Aquamicrobium defluvii]